MKRFAFLFCACLSLRAATGVAVPDLAAFDDQMTALMTKWKIPGAAIAVSHNGRLVLSRGYGTGDVEANLAVQPDSLFRIASISKTFTAIAALKLIEDGKLSADAKVFTLLSGFPAPTDARVSAITVRQLLQMTAGWDPAKSGDFMFQSPAVVQALGVPAPATCADTIRYALTKPLDNAPGTVYAYANINYCILGRIVEKASGQTFDDYFRTAILTPLGGTRTQLGHSLLSGRLTGELRYYDYPNAPLVKSVFATGGSVPDPYGGFNLDTFDSLGGYVASAPDVLRFVDAIDGRHPPALLKATSLATMTERPAAPVSVGAAVYTGFAWVIQPITQDTAIWYHFGGLAGTSTYAMHQVGTGVSFVALFNSRPQDSDTWETEMSTNLANAARGITHWPSTDQYVAGPEIFSRDVVNAADYAGGGVSPGEIVTLFPSNAGPDTLTGFSLDATGKLATVSGATRVLFDNVPAPMVYSITGQVSAIVPYEVANKATTQVLIEYKGVQSPAVPVTVLAALPAIFTLTGGGTGPAVVVNETGCCNSASTPAARGSIAVLFATGEGQTSPGGITGSLSNYTSLDQFPRPVLQVTLTVGGIGAEIVYAGEAPASVAGELQVNFRIPANAPVGNAVPIVLTIGTARSPDGVTMAIK